MLKTKVDRKIAAIEMESAGVAASAKLRIKGPRFIAIRGISDLATEQKSKLEDIAGTKLRELCMKNTISLVEVAIAHGVFSAENKRQAVRKNASASVHFETSAVPVVTVDRSSHFFKFSTHFKVFQPSIDAFLKKAETGIPHVQITWHSNLIQAYDDLKQLMLEVENQDQPTSFFFKKDIEHIEAFYESANYNFYECKAIVDNLPLRIEKMIQGMNGFYGDYGKSLAIANLLKIASFKILCLLSYTLSHSYTKERYFPQFMEDWYQLEQAERVKNYILWMCRYFSQMS